MSEYSYTVILQPEGEGGYSVFVPALPGCHSQGETEAEALENVKEAIAAYIGSLIDHKEPIPQDIPKSPIVQTVKIVA